MAEVGSGTAGELEHVFWIGGGSGAGKSTIARGLAARHGLQIYATDDAMGRHATALLQEDAPYLAQFRSMSMDERWVVRSPEVMLETFHWFRGEGFPLIVDDLVQLPGSPPGVAEGFRLLPHLVAPLLTDARRAVWLLPTPAFRRAAIESRGTTWDIPEKTSAPARALDNMLMRDRLFTERLAADVKRLGLPSLPVELGTTAEELVAAVATLFRL